MNWIIRPSQFWATYQSLRHQLRMSKDSLTLLSFFSVFFSPFFKSMFHHVGRLNFEIDFDFARLGCLKINRRATACGKMSFEKAQTKLDAKTSKYIHRVSFINGNNFCDKCWHFCSYFIMKIKTLCRLFFLSLSLCLLFPPREFYAFICACASHNHRRQLMTTIYKIYINRNKINCNI